MDNLTPEQRSACMARVRSRNTAPELEVRSALHRRGLRFRIHAPLPGHPDIAFPASRVAVFVDGDFWHGYRFAAWRARLPVYWREKIEANRRRDRRCRRALRRMGWTVVRVWGHEVGDLDTALARVQRAVAAGRGGRGGGRAR